MRHAAAVLVVPMMVLGLAACGESSTTASGSGSVDWVLASEPAGAVSVGEAKAAAVEGETIVVRGIIGGRMEPITGESPVFTIMDLGVPHCGQMGEDDHCPTPWDYCCETPDTIRTNSATVQVVDASGAAVETDLVAGGLGALDEVVVVGTVGPRPSGDVLTVRATGVYRR